VPLKDLYQIVLAVLVIVGVILIYDRLHEPTTVEEASHELMTAQQKCKDWQAELEQHPEYFKSTRIDETNKRTKSLCETAINDATLDVEGATIRAKNLKQPQVTPEPERPEDFKDELGNTCLPSQRSQDSQGRWLCPKQSN
jgi:hypothetical protein